MSDLSNSPPPAPSTSTAAGTKRKSTGETSAPKRAKKSQPDPYAQVKSIIHTVLESPETFSLPTGEAEFRRLVVAIASYAKSLEGSIAVASSTGKPAPPPKTPEQVTVEADRLTDMINRGISKQMSWKPSCKTGSAKYAYDGVCADPRVFGAAFRLDGPPTWKAKKFTQLEFETMVGAVTKSIRYDTLRLSGDVNVRWNSDTGEFKISGSYGK
ncbi:hypothetical protein CTheo_5616 [Ceratobasidium theobromae]|uniref:Uncharacterized protein n=1 Tax=Ceratobasidium theobromae TaxID=1582974 RepID=A0A5N5QGN6_9AGAM|nr:hypothetical protein CTheo_5616 [Ceratobasidium theobromae]